MPRKSVVLNRKPWPTDEKDPCLRGGPFLLELVHPVLSNRKPYQKTEAKHHQQYPCHFFTTTSLYHGIKRPTLIPVVLYVIVRTVPTAAGGVRTFYVRGKTSTTGVTEEQWVDSVYFRCVFRSREKALRAFQLLKKRIGKGKTQMAIWTLRLGHVASTDDPEKDWS